MWINLFFDIRHTHTHTHRAAHAEIFFQKNQESKQSKIKCKIHYKTIICCVSCYCLEISIETSINNEDVETFIVNIIVFCVYYYWCCFLDNQFSWFFWKKISGVSSSVQVSGAGPRLGCSPHSFSSRQAQTSN